MVNDFPDYKEKISREPVRPYSYVSYLSYGGFSIVPGKTTQYLSYSIPDDGYLYTLVSFRYTQFDYTSLMALGHNYKCFAGFLLDQNTSDYVWNCAGYCGHKLLFVPSRSGGLSLSYPAAFVMSAYNSLMAFGGLEMYINMYKKLKDV
jgi:hypothetical protein